MKNRNAYSSKFWRLYGVKTGDDKCVVTARIWRRFNPFILSLLIALFSVNALGCGSDDLAAAKVEQTASELAKNDSLKSPKPIPPAAYLKKQYSIVPSLGTTRENFNEKYRSGGVYSSDGSRIGYANDTIIVDFCDNDGTPSRFDDARAYAITIQILPETPEWFEYNEDEYALFDSRYVSANLDKYSDAMLKVMEHVDHSDILAVMFPRTNGNYIENDIYDARTRKLIGVVLEVVDLR